MFAMIRLTNENHGYDDFGIILSTIYGDIPVHHNDYVVKGDIMIVNADVFIDENLNPCHMVNGFIKLIK